MYAVTWKAAREGGYEGARLKKSDDFQCLSVYHLF